MRADERQAKPITGQEDVTTSVKKALLKIGHDILAADIEARAVMGEAKYGTRLKTQNGRSAILDLLQELEDALMYSAQAFLEGRLSAHVFDDILKITAHVKEKHLQELTDGTQTPQA